MSEDPTGVYASISNKLWFSYVLNLESSLSEVGPTLAHFWPPSSRKATFQHHKGSGACTL